MMPIIKTERLKLRPLTLNDAAAAFCGWTGDAEAMKYVSWLPHKTIEETTKWLKEVEWKLNANGNIIENDNYIWGFELKETGKLIGSGGLIWESEWNLFQVGYNINKDYWAFGYTTEAMRAIIQFASVQLKIKRLMGGHAKDNLGSARVLEKLGFVYHHDSMTPHIDGIRTFDSREYMLDLEDNDYIRAFNDNKKRDGDIKMSDSTECKLEEMSDFFNNRAEVYEEKHLELLAGGIESKRIIASFLPNNTRNIIDFGIGTGLELEAIYKRFPDIKVTGLDIAKDMLEQLKKKYADKTIDLRCVSYLEYDFDCELYDAALSVMTFHHYSHDIKTGLYRRIHKCLKQGGVYVECDYMLSEHEFENAQAEEDFLFAEYERIKSEQGLDEGKEYHYDTPCTVGNQKTMLLQAGFKSVKEVWRTKNNVILLAEK